MLCSPFSTEFSKSSAHFTSYSTSQFGLTAFISLVISHMWPVVTLTEQCTCRASRVMYLNRGILRWTVLLLQQEGQKSNTGEVRVCVWCREGVQIQLLRETMESLSHWILQNWVQIQELPLTSWECLGRSLYLSKTKFPPVKVSSDLKEAMQIKWDNTC